MKKFVIYTHTGRKEKRKPTFTHEAQTREIDVFLSYSEKDSDLAAEIIGRFQEEGSGADNDRPELEKALDMAKSHDAELLVSKLDRLSRSPAVLAKLLKYVRLRVAAMPGADGPSLYDELVRQEAEREATSQRTKTLLAEAKERGVKLGGYREGSLEKATVVRSSYAIARTVMLSSKVLEMRENGMSMAVIAAEFNAQNVATERGGRWDAKAIKRILDRMETMKEEAASHLRSDQT